MNVIKNFFGTNMVKKIIIIILILIVLITGLLYIFSPTTKLVNNLKKINGTNYDLENYNKIIIYHNKCQVAIYPTKNFIGEEVVTLNGKNKGIYVKTQTTNKYVATVSISPIHDSVTKEIMELSKFKEPKICESDKEFNYFVYNGKNYLYMIDSIGFTFYVPINNDYLYQGHVSNYKNLNKEDIESILYFEVI